ncbi:MAG TPA: hypothetical protein VF131_08675 [Blastocatellia bacterium]|nr:hypothetical protein [Blastocatellia bacterium]
MSGEKKTPDLRLHYTIICEDVRLEVNHKLSLMGLFYSIQVPQLPVTLLKMAIVNHWSGAGQYLAEVRILTPDRSQPIAVSPPSPFEVPTNGFADNVTIFANVSFPAAGNYVVQTLINSNLFAEQVLTVTNALSQQEVVTSETIQ